MLSVREAVDKRRAELNAHKQSQIDATRKAFDEHVRKTEGIDTSGLQTYTNSWGDGGVVWEGANICYWKAMGIYFTQVGERVSDSKTFVDAVIAAEDMQKG